MPSAHTPGPWKTNGTEVTQADGCGYICDTSYCNRADGRQAADASLIAAAPDMLDALRQIVEANDGYGSEATWANAMAAARAAIAKAEA